MDFNFFLKVRKIQIALEHKFSGILIIGNNPRRTVYITIFQKSRMRPAVRIYQAVHAEVSVMDYLPMISAVKVYMFSFKGYSVINGVVTPLPDKAAAHGFIFMEQFEVVLQIPRAVSHSMAVLTENHGLCGIMGQIILYILKGGVHPAV